MAVDKLRPFVVAGPVRSKYAAAHLKLFLTRGDFTVGFFGGLRGVGGMLDAEKACSCCTAGYEEVNSSRKSFHFCSMWMLVIADSVHHLGRYLCIHGLHMKT